MTCIVTNSRGQTVTEVLNAPDIAEAEHWLEDALTRRGFEVHEVETGVVLVSKKKWCKGKVRLIQEELTLKEVKS